MDFDLRCFDYHSEGRLLVELVAFALVGVPFLAALYFWGRAIYFGLKMTRSVRAGIRVWSGSTGFNPANVLFLPHLLTADGLSYRKRCIVSLVLFLSIVGSALATAYASDIVFGTCIVLGGDAYTWQCS